MKNFQYGISRPLGNWEIQQTKAGTVLVDTLYRQKLWGTIKNHIIFSGEGVGHKMIA